MDASPNEQLLLWRRRHRLTQEQASVSIGETKLTWNQWEKNGVTLPDNLHERLAEASRNGFAPIARRPRGHPAKPIDYEEKWWLQRPGEEHGAWRARRMKRALEEFDKKNTNPLAPRTTP
jgi:hypothetical protein